MRYGRVGKVREQGHCKAQAVRYRTEEPRKQTAEYQWPSPLGLVKQDRTSRKLFDLNVCVCVCKKVSVLESRSTPSFVPLHADYRPKNNPLKINIAHMEMFNVCVSVCLASCSFLMWCHPIYYMVLC